MFRFLVFLVVVTTCFASEIDVHKIQQRILEDLINSTIESIRPDIPDPLIIDNLEITIPSNDIVNGSASLNNLELDGLQGFQVTVLNFTISGFQLNFTIIFPDIEFKTNYTLDATTINDTAIFGDGSVSTSLKDIVIQAGGNANLTDGISINNIWVLTTISEDSSINIDGLFEDDDDISQLVTDVLDNNFAKFVDENQDVVSGIVSPLVEFILNSILNIIFGGNTTEAPLN